jgi:hypothetical protein
MLSVCKPSLAIFVIAMALADAAILRAETAAERGYWLLANRAYLPPDFSQELFDSTWRVWEEPLRSQAAEATPEERRRMAFSRYGLTPREDDPTKSVQYVVDQQGNWCMSCLACHQGKVAGRAIPGVSNSLFALQTLSEEMRLTKLQLKQPLTRMDVASMFMPLGGTNGTTNAVMFGVVLMAQRDADLNVLDNNTLPAMTHHDHDAPAWWQYHRKSHIYIDGFAPKSHRALMQFTLVKQNGPETFRQREAEFGDIDAYLESLTSPPYPYSIDHTLADQGSDVFAQHCATCHGTYGPDGKYPEKLVPIDEVGTDRVRLDALLPKQRKAYGNSWFTQYGREPIVANPNGYVAPPLDGIWATAPYFHNGSVPTLWDVLHPDERPVVWMRNEDGYDAEKLGLEVKRLRELPGDVASPAVRRRYFNTREFSKSAAGHDFANALDEPERRALLEYLKTL